MEFLAPKRHGFFRRLKETELGNLDILPLAWGSPHFHACKSAGISASDPKEAFIPERSIDDMLVSSMRPYGKDGMLGSK
jgi:hypothetical protein